MSSTSQDIRTATGHVVGAIYRSSYWGYEYKVLGETAAGSVEVELVKADQERGVVGDRWIHRTLVGRDQVIG